MNTNGKRIRVFLVNDYKSTADGLAVLINTNKTAIEVVGMAHNKKEAITSIAKINPDVVLLDAELNDKTGIEILPKLLKKTDAKFIILSGIQNPVIHETAILKGARGVLLKSDSGQVISKAIEKVYYGELWLYNRPLNKVLNQLLEQTKKEKIEFAEENKITALTNRERQIIKALIEQDSSTNKDITKSLPINNSTLKNHLTTIYRKLGVRNRIELLKFALKHELDKD